MKEGDFWSRLEFRLCDEMSAIESCRKIGLWCDGLVPEEYRLSKDVCCVIGKAYLYGNDPQGRWEFRLELPKGTRNLDDIDWASLLPKPELTRWMSVDFEFLKLDLDPAAAC